jgi:hypothetical protein
LFVTDREPASDRAAGRAGGAHNRPSRGNGSKIVATYDYTDEDGRLLYQVVRRSDKSFPQRRPDGSGGWIWRLDDTRRVLYRLPQVIEAVRTGRRVWIVEGEKDVHALEAAGEVATCNSGGAGCWQPEDARYFRGAKVAPIADKDKPGRGHALDIVRSLEGVASVVRIGEAAEGCHDVSDTWPRGTASRSWYRSASRT